MTGRAVTGIDLTAHLGDERIPSRTVIWAAGVTASGLAGRLAELSGAESDRAGRVTVEPELTLRAIPRCSPSATWFASGSRAASRSCIRASPPSPCSRGATPRRSCARVCARETTAFRYRDKGNLATIGRGAAVADIKGLRLSGFIAWLTWLFVHLWYLIGFQNRLVVLIRWSTSFCTPAGARG